MEGTLIVACCSNAKVGGGKPYKPGAAVWDHLPRMGRALQRRRNKALEILLAAQRNHWRLAKLPYNEQLVAGPDFGDNEQGKFLPAHRRYRGRFYREVPASVWRQLGADILIVSGLYGLAHHLEPIQRYSLHVHDSSEIAQVWKRDGLITRVLAEWSLYRRAKRIVNLVGDPDYIAMIDWLELGSAIEVWHVVAAQDEGPASLPALGNFLASLAKRARRKKLEEVAEGSLFETKYGPITFTRTALAPTTRSSKESVAKTGKNRQSTIELSPREAKGLSKKIRSITLNRRVSDQCNGLPPRVKASVFKALDQILKAPNAKGLGLEKVRLPSGDEVMRCRLTLGYRMHFKIEADTLKVIGVGVHSLQGIG